MISYSPNDFAGKMLYSPGYAACRKSLAFIWCLFVVRFADMITDSKSERKLVHGITIRFVCNKDAEGPD